MKPRRNRINTIAKVSKTVLAKTPIIPVIYRTADPAHVVCGGQQNGTTYIGFVQKNSDLQGCTAPTLAAAAARQTMRALIAISAVMTSGQIVQKNMRCGPSAIAGCRKRRIRIARGNVQAVFCRRRHQPSTPPLAKSRPGSPAPATGPGAAMTLSATKPN